MSHRVLAGDIGGTNARFALVDVSGETEARIVHETRYPSGEAPGLAPLVLRYLDEAPSRPEVACFGVACPVVEGECEATNLPWTVSAALPRPRDRDPADHHHQRSPRGGRGPAQPHGRRGGGAPGGNP